jgi:hypothetical protein
MPEAGDFVDSIETYIKKKKKGEGKACNFQCPFVLFVRFTGTKWIGILCCLKIRLQVKEDISV